MNLVQELHNNPFVLAPMAGITDNAFRSFMKEMGCGIVISELISANGLNYGSQKTIDLMKFEKIQSPVGIQLFGETPEIVAEGAKFVQDKGADFVDLNFGCPVKKVVCKGAGSAMLKDLDGLAKMLSVVKKAIQIPLTIKVRTGWDANTRNTQEVARIAYEEGITWMAIHGRTRTQGYEGLADWDYIAEVKAKAKLPIIGNGDIHTAAQAVERLTTSGCDAVMIGRGCLKNPWIFRQALNLHKKQNERTDKNFIELINLLNVYLQKDCEEKVIGVQLKKFSSWFSAGYPGSAQFRKDVFQQKDSKEILNHVETYFSSIAHLTQTDTSAERFLMGGHG
ncbi:MAG: tRNA dihydrouridine synthase DusB [Bdellovibrionota bacterium]